MNRYKLVHVTQFSYDGPVSESYNELRLRPRHDDSQSCLSFRITTTPDSRAIGHQDYYGNWVHQFHILPEHRKLRVETEGVILMHPVPPPPISRTTLAEMDAKHAEIADEHFDWLAPSNYCPFVPEILKLAADAERECDGTVHGFAQTASSLIHAGFRYQQGATHVHSSVEDCLRTKAGVCQDFSHILLATLRSRGVPARYVSGYLVPRQGNDQRAAMERVIGGLASHAWVQACIPGMDWVGLDPTSGEHVEAQQIRIAYGRDYGDVPPVRGVYKGHAGQSLAVDVHVRPAVDDEGAEQLQETSATPPVDPLEEEQQQQQQQQ
ncbi:MAG: transglutaminase, N-terminal domain protein [Bryobacterales bacterium]|nr:transglutaminase, N-terminal domain protein [Bryobacterales bacterium]